MRGEGLPALGELVVADDGGLPLTLGTLWRDAPVVLGFLRHWG
jgi:hypothetical protein